MKEVKIKDICEKGSSNLKQKDVENKNGSYPVFGASGLIGHLDTYHQENSYIAIVKDGSGIGRVTFMPPQSSVIGTMQYILPKTDYDIKYIGYCLQSLDLSKYKQGAAIPHIYFRDYGERLVKVVDSLSEQKEIVEYLDSSFAKIDKLKENAAKNLEEAKALFQSALKDALEPKEGWITSTLKDECHKITDGTHQTPHYFTDGYIFLSSKNVTNRVIDWDNVKYIDEAQHQTMQKRVSPKVGDILLAKNGTTGVGAIVDREIEFDIYVSLALLRTKGNVIPEYMLCFVNSPMAKQQFNKRLIGMGVPNLHLGEINQVEISYPPNKTEQKEIVKRLNELDDKVNTLQQNYSRICNECDALKQAILRQVFE